MTCNRCKRPTYSDPLRDRHGNAYCGGHCLSAALCDQSDALLDATAEFVAAVREAGGEATATPRYVYVTGRSGRRSMIRVDIIEQAVDATAWAREAAK